jgi:hypothetical protein
MDMAKFFAGLRSRTSGVFGTSLSPAQVDGTERIIEAGEARQTPLRHLAYILATAYHETAHTMPPVNGTDQDSKIAGYAKAFETALRGAGYGVEAPPVPVQPVPVQPKPDAPAAAPVSPPPAPPPTNPAPPPRTAPSSVKPAAAAGIITIAAIAAATWWHHITAFISNLF